MFVFGRETVFLSHLPMFMAPHDAQLLLEVALENAGGSSLTEVWSGERESHPDERLYTMMPEKFALSSLYASDPPERGSFRARFFRGHLERGGEPIPELEDVIVRITTSGSGWWPPGPGYAPCPVSTSSIGVIPDRSALVALTGAI
jgi:hypothetical protein